MDKLNKIKSKNLPNCFQIVMKLYWKLQGQIRVSWNNGAMLKILVCSLTSKCPLSKISWSLDTQSVDKWLQLQEAWTCHMIVSTLIYKKNTKGYLLLNRFSQWLRSFPSCRHWFCWCYRYFLTCKIRKYLMSLNRWSFRLTRWYTILGIVFKLLRTHKNQVQYDICIQEDRHYVRRGNGRLLSSVMWCHADWQMYWHIRGTWCFTLILKTEADGSFEMLLHRITSLKTTFVVPAWEQWTSKLVYLYI